MKTQKKSAKNEPASKISNPNEEVGKMYEKMCKCKVCFTCVYIIFKYGKRLRFASSFNDCLSYLIPFRLAM